MHQTVSYIVAGFVILGAIINIIIHMKAVGRYEGIINTKQEQHDKDLNGITDILKDHDGRLKEVEMSVTVALARVETKMESVERELTRVRDAVHEDRVDLQTKLLKALLDKNRGLSVESRE